MIHSWLSSSVVRHFPHSPAAANRAWSYDAARNERFSFQVALRLEPEDGRSAWPVEVTCAVQAPRGWTARIRRVGHVPVTHRNTATEAAEIDGMENYPGFVPDPLFDQSTLTLPPAETQAFYLSFVPVKQARPGNYSIVVTLTDKEGQPVRRHTAVIRLHDVTLLPRRNFAVTNWFYADALIDWYKTDLFDSRFWKLAEAYFRNMVAHGQDTIYIPVFTPPLDGVKRPSQLLRVKRAGSGRYVFDWSDVRTYVRLAKRCGLTRFEWSHLFTQWGCANALRIYEGQGRDEKLLWPPETPATGAVYRRFLEQYLPELNAFCAREKILRTSYFHVSDEPHGDTARDNYIKARGLLKELAPWIQVMDALSEIEYGRNKLTDMPVPSVSNALEFIGEGLPCWCYYCCGPRGPFVNRLLDTPLAKIRMNGWLFYRWPFLGFLHWGYNYWCESQTRTLIDPFTMQDGLKWPGWAYGDTFLVYPGEQGPIDSLRHEAFADSLQEYSLLQTLGIDRESRLLSPLKSFQEFPKTEAWILKTRKALFASRYTAKGQFSTRKA
jgi:hypothetical protein